MEQRKTHKVVPGCQCGNKNLPITHLGIYFELLSSLLKKDGTFWFRGHSDIIWSLTPSALRDSNKEKRDKALSLIADFKLYSEMKLRKIPDPNDELGWIQVAQHYGLPTRLLDWTKNAAIALYFACYDKSEDDGAVFLLNPIDLNRVASTKESRVFDPHKDSDLIKKYLKLEGGLNPGGLKTIAINPTWNSERITLQQGVFTLHGSRFFTLDDKQASSLVYLKINRTDKRDLLQELERIGINEMSIFPETEHMCRYLKRRENLC